MAELGNKDWGYEQVLPFFRRAEANERLNDRYHSSVGAVNVTEQVQHNPLSKAFVRAPRNSACRSPVTSTARCKKASAGTTSPRRTPAGRAPRPLTSSRSGPEEPHRPHPRAGPQDHRGNGQGHRSSTRSWAGSRPGTGRPGVDLEQRRGQLAAADAAFRHRPGRELKKIGIPVVHDLPGVGKNFQDHMDVYLTAETTPVSYNSSDRPDKAALAGLQYITTRTGPITASVCEAGMFVKSGPDVATPDIQMHALPAYVIDHGRDAGEGPWDDDQHLPLAAHSVGSVTLRTANPDDPPAIDPAFLTDPYDWEKSLEGFRWGREMMRSEAYQSFVVKEYLPSADVQTDKEVRALCEAVGQDRLPPGRLLQAGR